MFEAPRERRHLGRMVMVLSVFLASGSGVMCGDEENTNPQIDSGPPLADASSATAVLKGLTEYSTIKGTASIEAEVTGVATKLELLADGKVVSTLTASPWKFSLDTTKLSDGVCKLSLKAHSALGAKTSSETPVVVLNKGEEIKFTDGSSGTVIVPSTGYVEQHLKYHWTMPDGIKQIIGLLAWDQTGFKLELALGLGSCPENGTTAVKKDSSTSPVMATFKASSSVLTTGQWFAHVQLLNSTEVLGKSTKFSIKGFLLK